MQKREKILAGIVAGLLALYAGNWVFQSALQGPLDARYRRIDSLKSEIEKKEKEINQARKAAAKLEEWGGQSLPSDPKAAQLAYKNWLLDLASRAGFTKQKVDTNPPGERRGVYVRLPFSVSGRATLEQTTRFLYDFYRADLLHQIQRIDIKPVQSSDELDLRITIEGLVLPAAPQSDELVVGRSTRLAFEALADYRPITDRNLFGQGGAIGFDPADFTVLTGVIEVGGESEAWLKVHTTGETMKLRRGQQFEVGQFSGRIADVDAPDVIIESDDERWLLTLGDSLTQATALPPEF